MGYWISLLLLQCLHSSIALPTEKETKHQDVADDIGESEETQEMISRNQDPTENIVCRFFKMVAPQQMVMVARTPGLPVGLKNVVTPASVGLREYQFAALCVSPDKPRPYPYFFAPAPPLVAPIVSPIVVTDISKAPTAPSVALGSHPSSILSAPPPGISLVFSSPVGSIGIGSVSSPAVNIEMQSITDSIKHPTWLLRRILIPSL